MPYFRGRRRSKRRRRVHPRTKEVLNDQFYFNKDVFTDGTGRVRMAISLNTPSTVWVENTAVSVAPAGSVKDIVAPMSNYRFYRVKGVRFEWFPKYTGMLLPGMGELAQANAYDERLPPFFEWVLDDTWVQADLPTAANTKAEFDHSYRSGTFTYLKHHVYYFKPKFRLAMVPQTDEVRWGNWSLTDSQPQAGFLYMSTRLVDLAEMEPAQIGYFKVRYDIKFYYTEDKMDDTNTALQLNDDFTTQ